MRVDERAVSEPRDIANEIIENATDMVSELHPVDALMALAYVREHLTAHVQCVLADAYYGELKRRKEGDDR